MNIRGQILSIQELPDWRETMINVRTKVAYHQGVVDFANWAKKRNKNENPSYEKEKYSKSDKEIEYRFILWSL